MPTRAHSQAPGEAPGISRLARRDGALRYYGLLTLGLVLLPLVLALEEADAEFLSVYAEMMLTEFSLPLAVLAGLVAHRLYRLEQLAQRGRYFAGSVKHVWRGGRGSPARLEIVFATSEGEAVARLMAAPFAAVPREGDRVRLLVDYPRRPGNAVMVD